MKNWVSCLLITLIAMQSLLAVADVHQIHQPGSSHVSVDEGGMLVNTDGHAVHEADQQANSVGCQHCCHCHSPQLLILFSVVPSIAFHTNRQRIAEPNGVPFSGHPLSLFRPPRV